MGTKGTKNTYGKRRPCLDRKRMLVIHIPRLTRLSRSRSRSALERSRIFRSDLRQYSVPGDREGFRDHGILTTMRIRPIQFFACLALLSLLSSQQGVRGAEQNKKGREIFRQLCAKCHGQNGEGVKGKYDDALRGDWAIEKLTRYIDKNMPDDAPEKCVGSDAEAVARYIYDTFYSREARPRNHPPRVEPVHLTNRQYVNTVADLLKHFTGSDGALTGERGLRATYYSAKDFNGDKKVIERI